MNVIARRTIAVGLFLLAAGTVFMWVRSNDVADTVSVRGRHVFVFGSTVGTVVAIWQKDERAEVQFSWGYAPFSQIFGGGYDPRRQGVLGGFTLLAEPTQYRLTIPFWFLTLTTLLLAYSLTLRHPWQFSIRNLLAVTTLLAVVLGLVAGLDR